MCESNACEGRCARLRSFLTGHRTHWSEPGAPRPVCEPIVNLPTYETGEHRRVRCSASGDPMHLQTSLRTLPVCTRRIRCQLDRLVLCR